MDKRLPKTAAPRDLGRIEALPNVRRAAELVGDRLAVLGRGIAPAPGQDRQPGRSSRADPRRRQARPARRPILARPFRPARRAGRRRRPLSHAQLDALQWLAGRSGAGLCPHHPGIELPDRRGQPGRRGRPDAGPARHRRRHGPQPRHQRQRRLAQGPAGQHRLWPGLHRADPRQRGHPRPAAQGHRRL